MTTFFIKLNKNNLKTTYKTQQILIKTSKIQC